MENKNTQKYIIEDYETGTAIEERDTYADAAAFCEKCEKDDRKNGVFAPGFYAIRKPNGEVERYNY